MAVTLTVHATKPSGAQFFQQSSADNLALLQSLNAWTKAQPGFVNQTSTDPTADTRTVVTVWDTVEHYASWLSARASRPEQIARVSYNKANGITSTSNETVS